MPGVIRAMQIMLLFSGWWHVYFDVMNVLYWADTVYLFVHEPIIYYLEGTSYTTNP